jgi:hypothetical protein
MRKILCALTISLVGLSSVSFASKSTKGVECSQKTGVHAASMSQQQSMRMADGILPEMNRGSQQNSPSSGGKVVR